jgi:trehalose 6-phosphate synthase
MLRAARFVLALVAGLALVTFAASVVVERGITRWFEKDLALRGQLAVRGSRAALLDEMTTQRRPARLRALLSELTQDERIMAAELCSADFVPLARSPGFPQVLTCAVLQRRLPAREADTPWRSWTSVDRLPGGSVHVSAVPLRDDDLSQGVVVLVQDLSFAERREGETQRFLALAFGFLALSGSVIAIIAAKLAWSGWSNDLRRFLHGEKQRPEFQPIMKDVRALADRIVADTEADREAGVWSPDRLRHTLNRHLHGEKVLVVANREPYIHERSEDGGEIRVRHPASGLVTALEPVLRACSGTWIAHGSGSADRDTVDRNDCLRVPPGDESYLLRRIWLTPQEENGYYYGFANEGLWPLCHIADVRPIFRSDDWSHYQAVNQKFADALCAEADSDDPIVLVQDYHFALLPRLIRERLPRSTVITFWHIPWPNSQRFGICPWRTELLEGMLGASIVGFHTRFDCNNFLDSVDRFLESRIDREQNSVVQRGHPTLVRPYPISLEWPVQWLEHTPKPADCRASIFDELGLAPDALLGVGVDRLDYTKGVEERFLAIERMLEKFPKFRGRFTFVQLAAPSRTSIERYQHLNEGVERAAERVNERFKTACYRPIVLLRAHHEPPTVYRYYRAADVCCVTSLHDGMNLVAKEFVSSRDDERGALVLSQFTGAARELTEALMVNPYDVDQTSSALAAALDMSGEEQGERMRAMRRLVSDLNVYRWAGRMLVDAARLRNRDRLTDRLGLA